MRSQKSFRLSKLLRTGIKCSCDVFGKCGGCCYRHVGYDAELRYKTEHVRDVFKKNYPDCPVNIENALPSVTIDGYHATKRSFRYRKDGKMRVFCNKFA